MVNVDGRSLLFHIPTTSLFETDRLALDVIAFCESANGINLNQIEQIFEGRHDSGRVRDVISSLIALEVLDDRAPKADAKRSSIEKFPLSTLVLNVNTGCNLSCVYCYKEDLATPALGQRMTFDVARDSIEMLLRESPDRTAYNIVFFGGEPLSNMELIREVVSYAEDRFSKIGKRICFSLTTNGTLLTEEMVGYFDSHRFGITISMDGPKAIHDLRRRTVGGRGTYDVVSKKARMLLSRYRSRAVGARVTLTAGVTDVVKIWRHLKSGIGFHEVGFAPVTAGDIEKFNLTEKELIDVFEEMKTLGGLYLSSALKGDNIGFSNMHQLLTDIHNGTTKALPCGAGVGLLAVDKDGGLNLCHRFTGSNLRRFGNVREGVDRKDLGGFLEKRLDRGDTACNTCRIRNLCSGGCYHESYARYNDPARPTYHYCDLMRGWVDFGIGIYAQILKSNPGYFERHIAPRRAHYGRSD
ncbi:MAG: quinohemoprotein amine dehydrogenase maturation protein [Amphiplicatus sp.]